MECMEPVHCEGAEIYCGGGGDGEKKEMLMTCASAKELEKEEKIFAPTS